MKKYMKRNLIIKNWPEPDKIVPINFHYSWREVRRKLRMYYKREVHHDVIRCLRGEVIDVSSWSNDKKCYLLGVSCCSRLEGVKSIGLAYQYPTNPNNFFLDTIELKEGWRSYTPRESAIRSIALQKSKAYSFGL